MSSPFLNTCSMIEFHARRSGGGVKDALILAQMNDAPWPHIIHMGDPAALLALVDKIRDYLVREVDGAKPSAG